jgi:nitroimidazol reductase NimA-like FMN-containing flavoprotein (pyridoxamine 5'-phosphate oxidase superfamily)
MIASLPSEVTEVLQQYLTCEFSTLRADGVPSTTPMSAVWQPDHQRFILSTSVSAPAKLDRIRANSRVALLFSEPTGSGLSGVPAVLVQGRATVSDQVFAVEGMEDYWAVLLRRKPDIRRAITDPGARAFWPECFYWRARITVQPTKVWTMTGPAGQQQVERCR